MRFLAIDQSAATEITASLVFQSTEYEQGAALAAFLKNPNLDVKLGPRLRIAKTVPGVFMMGQVPVEKQFLVVDLAEAGLYKSDSTPEICLLDTQKLLRFAIKFWEKLRLSSNEKLIPNSSKAVIFPHPISLQTNFRISIELKPDARRLARRDPADRSMLVYRSGYDEGGGPKEEARLNAFREFIETRSSVIVALPSQSAEVQPTITSLTVTTLDGVPSRSINPFQGFDQWLELLTSKQKTFVLSKLQSPHRIQGPAGTGKTLCLVLKAISGLRRAQKTGDEHRALFITHSEATRRTVEDLVQSNDPDGFLEGLNPLGLQFLRLTTLQQLCGSLLQRDLQDTEFLDKDAMESKQLQALHVEDALSNTIEKELETYRRFMSPAFLKFLQTTDTLTLAEMFQHEISVVIKGRADESLENYRKLPALKYGLPAELEGDRNFIWLVFRKYQNQLQAAAQFDTDDIVLTTIGQLDTPIWRRRRVKDGYDAIYIDETHLFNVNELSVFHHLSRSTSLFPIAYSVDRSQAIGDRGWNDDDGFEGVLSPAESDGEMQRTEVKQVFRCSPEIVDLAFSVTSSGATLFTNFSDPLKFASSVFTAESDRKTERPRLITCGDDDQMIAEAFRRADSMAEQLQSSRCDVAIVPFTDELLARAAAYAREHNKPVEILKRRGDIEIVRRAQQTRRFVLSSPDYVGGLEFAGIVLVGVDDGRVPPSRTAESVESSNFLSYAAHNRLYVAVTRAMYRVEILVARERGPSALLSNAIANDLLLTE